MNPDDTHLKDLRRRHPDTWTLIIHRGSGAVAYHEIRAWTPAQFGQYVHDLAFAADGPQSPAPADRVKRIEMVPAWDADSLPDEPHDEPQRENAGTSATWRPTGRAGHFREYRGAV